MSARESQEYMNAVDPERGPDQQWIVRMADILFFFFFFFFFCFFFFSVIFMSVSWLDFALPPARQPSCRFQDFGDHNHSFQCCAITWYVHVFVLQVISKYVPRTYTRVLKVQ